MATKRAVPCVALHESKRAYSYRAIVYKKYLRSEAFEGCFYVAHKTILLLGILLSIVSTEQIKLSSYVTTRNEGNRAPEDSYQCSKIVATMSH